MSVDSPINTIAGIGGFGGGSAALVAELAGTGNSTLIGVVTAVALILVSAFVLRKAHRNIA